MPKITRIVHKTDRGRYWIFIDNTYCTSVRDRTFSAMNLDVGSEISCENLKELEKHHWKHVYGKDAWDKEKVRLNKVVRLIEEVDTRVKANIVGFGADSSAFIKGHPDEAGKPDIEVVIGKDAITVLYVEVSGTERMRGSTYWVRPDKMSYAKNHPDQDVWIVLHYALPVEKYVFIKPRCNWEYTVSEIVIKGSTERYVEFSDDSPEVVSYADFRSHLETRLDEAG